MHSTNPNRNLGAYMDLDEQTCMYVRTDPRLVVSIHIQTVLHGFANQLYIQVHIHICPSLVERFATCWSCALQLPAF